MSTLIDKWLEYLTHNKGRAETTAAKYRGYLDRLKEWAGDRDLLTLERQDLEQFVGIVMHQAGLSPRSRRALVAAVRGFYEYAKREGLVAVSPAEAIDYPKAGSKTPSILALKNAEKLLLQCDLNELKGVRDAAILGVLIGSGLRVSGVVSLNESRLIWWSDDKGREVLILKVVEKGDKERLVPLPAEARYLIKAYLGHHDLKNVDRSLDNGDQVLFVSLRNRSISEDLYHGEARRISPRSINDMIVAYGERVGIPRDQLHPHAFRHLYGTELAEDEVPTHTIQALLGHSDPKSSEVYIRLAMRNIIKAVDRANPLGKINTPVTQLIKQLENFKP